MKKFLASLTLIFILFSCSNAPETETGEIRTIKLIKGVFEDSRKPKRFIDARNLINREQIDAASVPVLFVELTSGQNGTLTPYPGRGIGQTWLGADGATVTLDRGVLKASRGMGDDLMGSTSFMPPWSKINRKIQMYDRKLGYLNGKNKVSVRIFECEIQKTKVGEIIEIWGLNFKVDKFEEKCFNSSLNFKNTYLVDIQGIVRRSSQYHSDTLGSIKLERLDR